MPEDISPVRPDSSPPGRPDRNRPEPAAIFIAGATLFAIFINAQNVGPILMLGVIALLLEFRLRPRD